MIVQKFNSLLELFEAFPTEQSCIDYLEQLRWKNGVVSPFDPSSKVYKCQDNKYKCKNTGKYFNVRTKTLFDNTKIPLKKWIAAIWLCLIHKRGISSMQLGRELGISQKSAWFMLQRIRKCFCGENDQVVSGEVEVDETFVGGKNKNRHKDKRVEKCQGRCFKDKTPIFGMYQRNGNLTAKVVPDTKRATLAPIIDKYVARHSVLYTDGWDYGDVQNNYEQREVDHGKHFYGTTIITEDGELVSVTTNHIECAWSHFKRMITGVYYKVSRKHLQMYVDEFVFRYNTRKISAFERFNLFLQNIENRITYKELIYG